MSKARNIVLYIVVIFLCALFSLWLTSQIAQAQAERFTIVGRVFEDVNCSGNRIPLTGRLVLLRGRNGTIIDSDITGSLGLYGFDVIRDQNYSVEIITETSNPYILNIKVYADTTSFGRVVNFNVVPCEQYFPVINRNMPSQINSSAVPNTSLIIKLNEKECNGSRLLPLPFIKVELVKDGTVIFEDFTNQQGLVGFANLPSNFDVEVHMLYFRRQVANVNTGEDPIKRLDFNLAHCPLLIPLISVAPPFQN